MTTYRCSQCDTKYSHDEYIALDRVPVNPDEDNPKKGSGYETVCECGAKFHSDRWQLQNDVEFDGEEFTVSTVALLIPHGLNHGDWFETLVRHPHGSEVVRRYQTQDEAEEGHQDILNSLYDGKFEYRQTVSGIDIVEGDDE